MIDRLSPREASTSDSFWLDGREQAAWDALNELITHLPAALDHETLEAAEVSYYDFCVLAALAASPGGTVRVGELARGLGSSLSRMSHTMLRLEKSRLVVRRPSPDDRRVTLVVLTDAGRALHERLAPVVITVVRRLILDALGEDGVDRLRLAVTTINTRVASTLSPGAARRAYRRSAQPGRTATGGDPAGASDRHDRPDRL